MNHTGCCFADAIGCNVINNISLSSSLHGVEGGGERGGGGGGGYKWPSERKASIKVANANQKLSQEMTEQHAPLLDVTAN